MNNIDDFKKKNLFQKYTFENEIINNLKIFFNEYFNYNDELDEIHNILLTHKFNDNDLKYFNKPSSTG